MTYGRALSCIKYQIVSDRPQRLRPRSDTHRSATAAVEQTVGASRRLACRGTIVQRTFHPAVSHRNGYEVDAILPVKFTFMVRRINPTLWLKSPLRFAPVRVFAPPFEFARYDSICSGVASFESFGSLVSRDCALHESSRAAQRLPRLFAGEIAPWSFASPGMRVDGN